MYLLRDSLFDRGLPRLASKCCGCGKMKHDYQLILKSNINYNSGFVKHEKYDISILMFDSHEQKIRVNS